MILGYFRFWGVLFPRCIRETLERAPFLTLLLALGSLLRGSISPRLPLILTPTCRDFRASSVQVVGLGV